MYFLGITLLLLLLFMIKFAVFILAVLLSVKLSLILIDKHNDYKFKHKEKTYYDMGK